MDDNERKYDLDIRENVIDMNVFGITDNDQQPRIVLICRDLSFIYVYTDIWRFYKSLRYFCVCLLLFCFLPLFSVVEARVN